MALSDTERRILINQYRILALLEPNNEAWEFRAEIYRAGYEAAVPELLEPMPAAHMRTDAALVGAAMDLYEQIARWAEKHDAAKGLSDHPHFAFSGFCAQREPHHWHLQSFLAKNERRFPALIRAFAKHAPPADDPGSEMAPSYRKMLDRCDALGLRSDGTIDFAGADADAVRSVLDAARA